MKRIRSHPLLAGWLAAILLWLLVWLGGGVQTLFYLCRGQAGTQQLAPDDWALSSLVETENPVTGEAGWLVSTDTDPKLHWTAPNPEGIYLETVELRVEQLTPGQAVVLYWKEPGQADFSAAQMVYAQKVADGVYRFDLGRCVVSEIRLDPDSVGGVTTRFNGVTLNPAEGWYTAFVPTATDLVLGLLVPRVSVGVATYY